MARRRQYSRKTKRTRRSKNKGTSKSRRRPKSRTRSNKKKKKNSGKRRKQSGGNANCENLYLNESGITMKSLINTNINLTDEITNDLLSGQEIDIPTYKVSINPN